MLNILSGPIRLVTLVETARFSLQLGSLGFLLEIVFLLFQKTVAGLPLASAYWTRNGGPVHLLLLPRLQVRRVREG